MVSASEVMKKKNVQNSHVTMVREDTSNNYNMSSCNCSYDQFLVGMLFCFLFSSCCSSGYTAMAQSNLQADNNNTVLQVNVGVILNNETFLGKMGLTSINMALSDLYAANPHYKTRLAFHVRQSSNDVVIAAAAAADLLHTVQVAAILGPESSMEAQFVIQLGAKAHVPIVSYTATSPLLSSIGSPYFIQSVQDDSSQVQAIAALMQAYGWRQAVPIYVGNEFGDGMVPFLADALQDIGTDMPYRSVISPSATDDQIATELYKLMTMQTRVFVVHMNVTLGSRLFLKAKQIGMMSQGYVWIITNGMANQLRSDLKDPLVGESMKGVLGVKTYVPASRDLQDFVSRWKRKFLQDYPTTVSDPRIDVYGIWAYDAASALARAVEQVVGVHGTNLTFLGGRREDDTSSTAANSNSDLLSFGVSQGGQQLLEAIVSGKFRGLSGYYHQVDGQLQASVFELINMVGGSDQLERIGYWTKELGLVRDLNSTNNNNNNAYSTLKDNLRAPIRLPPGDSTSIPKGWVIPANGKRLRIGVPVKNGFTEFVKVEYNQDTNTQEVTGFCIDVFDAVMATLPYSVPYDYIPFGFPNGTSAGSYNDLIDQVYQQKYDAVVGDITIVAERSQHVDFTLPYTESGVTMVAPIENSDSKKAWVFVRPLSWDLWATTLVFFIFIAFVIWVLEHRINPHFRGPPGHQAGASLYYSFSTMVFAHSQHVFSNLGRLVVIVWVFVLLILIQSYTASLTSLLTVEQLRPAVTNVEELVKLGKPVGYQDGSFVHELLLQMQFKESLLKSYGSVYEMHQLLSNGTENGGIAAAFDEIAYAKLLIDTYCSKYTMVAPTYRTGGFGFAFPSGSPLVSDVSRAVLAVTEGDTMTGIERKWFPNLGKCPDGSSTSITSTRLGLNSFWGLFLISGFVATCALLAFVSRFLYEHRHVWLRAGPDTSIGTRIRGLLRIFDQPNLQSHTFRINEPRGTSTTPNTPHSQSPYCYSDHVEPVFVGDHTSGRWNSPDHDVASSSNSNQEQHVVFELPNFYLQDGDQTQPQVSRPTIVDHQR